MYYEILLTVIICFFGVFVSMRHYLFFHKNNKEMARKLRKVFITDALIYLITLVILSIILFKLPMQIMEYLVWIRIPVFIANIYASHRLYEHYQVASRK